MSVHELPGIPDLLDNQLGLIDLPALPDLQIAPLRNPDPNRHSDAPVPLEPLTKSSNTRHQGRNVKHHVAGRVGRSSSGIKPSDVLSAKEAKKPHLAISELVQTKRDGSAMLQLPSFVSLSVVEKSPVPHSSQINLHKRPRLEGELDAGLVEMNRVLPRPSKKDDKVSRPVPLLPAMVTGLHEPPPSAGLLPSISDARPELAKTTSTSKMDVNEILTGNKHTTNEKTLEIVWNSTDEVPLARSEQLNELSNVKANAEKTEKKDDTTTVAIKDAKSRRQYRKWTDQETGDLIAGVNKYGIGKWKQILKNPAFNFGERSAVDLKDRYRILLRDSQHDCDPSHAMLATDGDRDSGEQPSEATHLGKISANSKHRKKRQRWTAEEDATLMAGVTKHGFQWSTIHADPDMQWADRRPTDLRDRIRTLFPEGYKRADTRSSAKDRGTLDNPATNSSSPFNPEKQGTAVTAAFETRSRQVKQSHLSPEGQQPIVRREQTSNDLATRTMTSNKQREPKDPQQLEHAGVTLPSLALGGDDIEWDNRLPPLLDWEEI